MKTLDLVQGSPEWRAHRAQRYNASDASAMMGCSPYVTRAELLHRIATGFEPEISQQTQHNFDRGHTAEAASRPTVEATIGQDLYPAVGVSDEYPMLSASFDGLTMSGLMGWECKLYNAEKAAYIQEHGRVPPADYWQCVQQLVVSRAESLRYSLVTEEGEEKAYVVMTLEADDEKALLAGWDQFDEDRKSYVPPAVKVEAVGRAPIQLPSLYVQLAGGVQATNLPQFKAAALEVFASIPTELSTDQDFADAAATVKWCEEIEDKLKAAKANAQGQMVTVDELFRTIDDLSSAARSKRLVLDKLVTARKEELRVQIAVDASRDYQAHLTAINKDLAVPVLGHNAFMETVTAAMKGKKTLDSLRAAASQAVATAKIAASNEATRHMQNIVVLVDAGRLELFGDRDQLVRSKTPEDLRNLVAARIAEADKREADRLEQQRQKIRAEEEAKAKAAADALVEQERERIRGEERAKLEAEAPVVMAQTQPAGPGAIKSQPALQEVLDAVAPAPVADAMRAANETPAPTCLPGEVVPMLNIGEINRRLAPISITADGLASLGFMPYPMGRTAKLYSEAEIPNICRALGRVLKNVIENPTARKAA